MKHQRAHGFTVIELVVAAAVFGILLTFAGTYFVSSAELSRLSQTRTEVQDKARTVMQLVTQDLQMVGASRYVSGSTVTEIADWVACSSANPCLSGTNNSSLDSFGGRYVTSLQPSPNADACRRFAYGFSSNTLQRSDVQCAAASNSFQDFAGNVLALDVIYMCSDSSTAQTPSGCPAGMYARSARVTVVVASDNARGGQDPNSYALVSGGSVACPASRVCFSLTQEVLLPNLKGS